MLATEKSLLSVSHYLMFVPSPNEAELTEVFEALFGDATTLLMREDPRLEILLWFPDPKRFMRCMISVPSEKVCGTASLSPCGSSIMLLN